MGDSNPFYFLSHLPPASVLPIIGLQCFPLDFFYRNQTLCKRKTIGSLNETWMNLTCFKISDALHMIHSQRAIISKLPNLFDMLRLKNRTLLKAICRVSDRNINNEQILRYCHMKPPTFFHNYFNVAWTHTTEIHFIRRIKYLMNSAHPPLCRVLLQMAIVKHAQSLSSLLSKHGQICPFSFVPHDNVKSMSSPMAAKSFWAAMALKYHFSSYAEEEASKGSIKVHKN